MKKEAAILKQFNTLLKNFKHYKNFSQLYPLRNKKDILKIPFTVREDLYKYSISNCPRPPFGLMCSSGSTGKPFIAFDSPENIFHNTKYQLFKFLEYSSAIDKRVLVFAQRPRIVTFFSLTLRKKRMRNTSIMFADDRFFQDITRMRELFKKTIPQVLFIFPADLDELFLLDKRYWRSIEVIISTGAPLSAEKIKQVRKMNPKIDIYNVFGCEEVGFLGIGKYPSKKMKLMEKGLYLEVLRGQEASESGEGSLVITDFQNLSTPVIRYLLGDKVKIEKKKQEIPDSSWKSR